MFQDTLKQLYIHYIYIYFFTNIDVFLKAFKNQQGTCSVAHALPAACTCSQEAKTASEGTETGPVVLTCIKPKSAMG